jgi:hypothetical protein
MQGTTNGRAAHARSKNLAAVAALAAALAGVPAATAAQVEFALPGGEGRQERAVMSGREFDALSESVGFDPAQRTAADAIFDDAQARMFAAKRTGDAAARTAGLFDRSAAATAARGSAARAMRTSLLAQADELFASLGAIARPEQQAALAHERRLARLRVVRATMPGPGFTEYGMRAGETDVATAVDAARIDGVDPERVNEALAGTLDRLADALVRLADARAAREVAQAEWFADRSTSDRLAEVRAQARDAYAQVSRVQRDAIAALDGVLAGTALLDAKAAASRAIWPTTADARSPRRVIEQLLGATEDPARRTAIEGIRDAWWAAWWPATLRMVESSETGPGRPPSDAGEARDAADRQAWKALAGVDEANKDFHLANAEPLPPTKGGGPELTFGRTAEPGLPGTEGGPGAVPGAAAVSIAFSAVTVASGDSDGQPGALPEGAEDAVSIAVADAIDGMANQVLVVGSTGVIEAGSADFDDDAGGPADLGIDVASFEGLGDQVALAGARLPQAMTDEEVRAVAASIGVAADEGVVAQIVRDYRDRVKASDEELGARVRSLLDGTAVAWPMPDLPQMAGLPEMPPQRPEVPIKDLREGVALLDQWTDRLGALDDGLIDSIASLGSPRPEAVGSQRERRARARANALRYPSAQGWDGPRTFVEPADALAASGADAGATAAALAAIEAWSPAALAAVEASREAMRNECVGLIESARGDVARPRVVGNGDAGPAFDEESMRQRAAAESRLAKARRAVGAQAIAGRDAVERALPEALRPAYRSAWLAAAVPSAYRDRSDALPAVDRARALADLGDAQRAQLDALRNDHASRHRASCDAIAEMTVAQRSRMEDAMQSESGRGMDSMFGAARMLSDARFERRELDAQTLRRLRSALTPEQARQVPQLQPRRGRGTGMPRGLPGAAPVVIPAPTPAAPAPTSP